MKRLNDMYKNRLKLIVLSAILIFLGGCRQYNLHEYKPVQVDILSGTLFVHLEGMYGKNYNKEGKRQADFGFPYSLMFTFSMPYTHEFSRFAVQKITLTGEESKVELIFPDVNNAKIKDPRSRDNSNADARRSIVSFRALLEDVHDYEDYRVRANIVVCYEKDRCNEQEIDVGLKTDFKIERRSDWLDRIMSA